MAGVRTAAERQSLLGKLQLMVCVWLVLQLESCFVLSDEDTRDGDTKDGPMYVFPFVAHEDGSHLSFDISGNMRQHRSKRSTVEKDTADEIYVVVPMEEETLVLDLRRTTHLVAPVAVSETSHNGTYTGHRIRADCYYHGGIRGMPGSRVAVSSCHGLYGTIETDTTGYFIEPLRVSDTHTRQRHVIYPEGARKDRRSRTDYITEEDIIAYHQMMSRLEASRTPARKKRQVDDHRFHLEVVLVVDTKLKDFHGEDRVEEYLLTLMNVVDDVYHHPTLGVVINIVVTKILYLTKDEASIFIVPGNAKATLDLFCVWADSVLGRHRTADNPTYHVHDFAIFLTKENIGPAGYAPVTGMCRPIRSCSVNRDEGLSSAFVIAHEIGHVFGMMHDGQGNNCGRGDPRDGRIMAPLVQSTFDVHYWTHCSSGILGDMIEHYPCLQDSPFDAGFPEYEKPYGQNWYPDDQCRQEFGEGFTKCKAFPMPMCDQLWCSTPGNEMMCKTKKSPPLDGTPCGQYSWCMKGICEHKSHLPSVDGGWSDWSTWSECSRTCRNGVQFRTRTCNNPSPINGEDCGGHRGEFQLCNQVECPEGADLRADQCSAFDPDVWRGGRLHTWLPRVSDYQSEKCLLMCISKNTRELLETSEPLIDGTPCDYENKHNVCVKGKCEKVGCDGVLGSEAENDLCGKCNGDNSECTQITGVYDKSPSKSYTQVLLLPKGARHIKISETEPKRHFIALRIRGIRNFLLNGGRREGRSSQLIYEGVRFFYTNNAHQETITSSGPLTTEIMVMIYPVHDLTPTNIHFEYIIPLDIAFGESAPFHGGYELGFERYVWDTRGWTDCSKSCGSGTQEEIYVCIDQYMNEVANASSCLNDEKPKAEKRECNTDECFRYSWIVRNWGECTATCGNKGIKERAVYCMKNYEGKNERIIRVRANRCADLPKPESEKECNRTPCPADWASDAWSECSKTCDEGVQARQVYCDYPNDGNHYECVGIKPISSRPCTIKACPNCEVESKCRNRGPLCKKGRLNKNKCRLALFKIMCCKACFLMVNDC